MGHQEQRGCGSESQKLAAIVGPTHLGVIAQGEFSLNLNLIPHFEHPFFILVSWRPRQHHSPQLTVLLGQPQLQHREGVHQGPAVGLSLF